MARIRLDIPADFNFTTRIPVRITDLNYGGHVGNDTILTLIHEARMQFLQQAGYSELDLAGAALIMGDVAIEFKHEMFYGDHLEVSVAAGDFSRVGFDLYYKLEKVTGDRRVLIAQAKTGMVCFNYQLRKVVAIPSGVPEKLALLQATTSHQPPTFN
ncbi:acyl-CoA thioesterase [Flavihumibacter stibioxidans]|uniref:Thioesterase n=1 Tax=Flavihumibacter stibioxidans TaxID=1834163 RepID=A0ABR7M5E0_9BACT|nr:thioesterase family protein [Flavihumibacter stibioxidans]MBC6490064.1 thioesterase [Flavihumibacter stibioxidans]